MIRDYAAGDWPALWPILREVIRAGDTYCLPPELPEAAARAAWITPAPDAVTVAQDGATLLGTAHIGANRPGPGDHVANGSYMVSAAARGRGVGRALVIDSLARARALGFKAMQFNAVVETNRGAIALYEDLGFAIVGTIPRAFRHPTEGPVALHIMHIDL